MQAINNFSRFPISPYSFDAEMEVVPLIDAALTLIILVLRGTCARNMAITTSGSCKPAFSACVGDCPLLVGEDKTKKNFASGSDPAVDLEKKTPWATWERFYGDIPYIFGYTCICSVGQVIMSFGILEKVSKKFRPLVTLQPKVSAPKFS